MDKVDTEAGRALVDRNIRSLHERLVKDFGEGNRNPLSAALNHLHAQGANSACPARCKRAALCLALLELLSYRGELDDGGPLLRYASGVHALLVAVERHASALAADGLKLLGSGNAAHEKWDGRLGGLTGHDHALLCVEPVQLVHLLQLVQLVGNDILLRANDALRWSEIGPRKRGRPRVGIARACGLHLRDGGWSYRDIAELIHDGHGRGEATRRMRRLLETEEPRRATVAVAKVRVRSGPAKRT